MFTLSKKSLSEANHQNALDSEDWLFFTQPKIKPRITFQAVDLHALNKKRQT